LILTGFEPSGHCDEESLKRATVRNGVRVAPPEHLLMSAAREGDHALLREITSKYAIDWKLIDEVFVVDRDRWDPPEWDRIAENLRPLRSGQPFTVPF
jgi:hypothetical protein